MTTRSSPARSALLGVALLALLTVVILLAVETKTRRAAPLR
jgi:hypothetical protein